MFNALRTDQLLTGIGRALRTAADADGPLEGYGRGQVLSALSITRLLTAEMRAAPEILSSLRNDVDAAIADDERPMVAEARSRLVSMEDGVESGEIIADLFGELPQDDGLREPLHVALREMTGAEVSALRKSPE